MGEKPKFFPVLGKGVAVLATAERRKIVNERRL